MKFLPTLFVLATVALLFHGCGSDDDCPAPEVTTGTLRLEFVHTAGGQPLLLQTPFVNPAGETYRVRDFKYYVSNVKLRTFAGNGAVFIAPDSYHLVGVSDASSVHTFDIVGITPGDFTELEFAIGVDNAKNTSIDNVGDLDPTNLMVWDWNTGYKFLLLEGTFQAPEGSAGNMVFHIGEDENYRILRLRFAQSELDDVVIRAGETTTLRIGAELDGLFGNPNPIRLADLREAVMFGPEARRVADNYARDMFRLLPSQH